MKNLHSCTMYNPFGDPPEYFLEGCSAIPVIRTPRIVAKQQESIDERRKELGYFKLSSCTQEDFNSFLFSSEILYVDIYDKELILNFIDMAINQLGYVDLYVDLIFAQEEDGSYLLVRKKFYNADYKPYIFKDNRSSSYSVSGRTTLFEESFLIVDGKIEQSDFYRTVYRFKERLYTDILVNCSVRDKVLPLLISYDEFGIVYVEYYYNNKRVSDEILDSVKPHFDVKQTKFDYFTDGENEAIRMFLI